MTGDRQAVDELLHELRPWLKLLVHRRLADDERHRFGESDIVQETLMRIHHGLAEATFSGDTESGVLSVPLFLGWIARILRNVIEDQRRHGQARKRDQNREVDGEDLIPLLATGQSPLQGSILMDQSVRLASALQRLPEHQRDVLQWRFFDQLSYGQISKQTGKSVGALRVVCSRAIERLGQDDDIRAIIGDEQ